MNPKTPALTLALIAVAFAGCTGYNPYGHDLTATDFHVPGDFTGAADDITWPQFPDATLRILDHGAFYGCADLGAKFTELTGATVECTSDADTGSALQRAIQGKGNPEFDVMYGADNLLMHQAVTEGVFQAYTPALAGRVHDDYVFFDHKHWPATPVDHGYIALNIDTRHEALADATIDGLDAVRNHASAFVTQDPRTSTPGLGFFLTTVAVLGDDWQDYWTDLFEGDVKITSGWKEAYVTHFSGGYGIWEEGHIGDRPIVTSYTESPAYEAYWGAEYTADVLLHHGGDAPVLHQIQTMAILDGTKQSAIAQAWIEFTLTDDFQVTAAPTNAVYPVVTSTAAMQSVADTYGTDPAVHPIPGTFGVADFDFERDGPNVATWVAQWVELCEQHGCT